ncbi:MAG: bifunctional glutamate N-acetyltransferase/amino-acid acetyltransferase ArgJ [Acidimicrobiales bacterium]
MSHHLALPQGFVAYTGHAGLRDAEADVAVVLSERPCAAAGMFTKSRFAGPSVALSRVSLEAERTRAFVVMAKNANVANGSRGRTDAEEVVALVAAGCGLEPTDVAIASTGVIGRPYPMEKLRGFLGGLGVARWGAGAGEVAAAMMTTDTVAKTAVRQVGPARVVGMAKGVGMIEPDMATLLAFVLTDAEVERAALEEMWRGAVDPTFNCLSIDTDTSTSDTALVLANGAAGRVDGVALSQALREVCLDLTLQIARDGEGATKLITVTVSGARDAAQARRVAKAVVNSPLVKTAVHGADPNWGRVAMAVGKCSDDTDIDPERVRIAFGGLEVYPAVGSGEASEGTFGEETLSALKAIMSADHVDIEVDLGIAAAEATVYGCDLSAGYVSINADYTT